MQALLFLLFSSLPFLTALLSLVSDLHIKSICNYFSVCPHSSSPPLSLTPVSAPRSKTEHRFPSQQSALSTALAKRPTSGPQQVGTDAAGHAYQLRQLNNGRGS
jgi:hypothetical protein